jgi:hypothetical protein
VQALVRRAESLTLHVTMEAPRGKTVPLGGKQPILKGGWPATTCGGSKTTTEALPSSDWCVTGVGQTRMGARVEGLVGPPHPVTSKAPTRTGRLRR